MSCIFIGRFNSWPQRVRQNDSRRIYHMISKPTLLNQGFFPILGPSELLGHAHLSDYSMLPNYIFIPLQLVELVRI